MGGMREFVQSVKTRQIPGERSRMGQPRTRIGHKLILSFVLLVMVVVGMSGWVLFELTRRSLEWQMRVLGWPIRDRSPGICLVFTD
jgi:hypothetical protein